MLDAVRMSLDLNNVSIVVVFFVFLINLFTNILQMCRIFDEKKNLNFFLTWLLFGILTIPIVHCVQTIRSLCPQGLDPIKFYRIS